MRPEHDAVVLAGGRARRMGGASKPDVLLAGRRLIERSLDAARGAQRVVVVGPATTAPPGTLATLEDPPGGGPVAALAAGLRSLPDGFPWVLVLACDVPRAEGAVDALFAAADAPAGSAPARPDEAGQGRVDGAVVVDATGRSQPLVAVYRRASLEAALDELARSDGLRDASMRRLLAPMRLAAVPDLEGHALDIDTWRDLARAESEVTGLTPPPEP